MISTGKCDASSPFHRVRSDLALGEFPHAAAKVLLFFGEAEFHGFLGAYGFWQYADKVLLI